jgi:hypothetical protein
VADLIPESSIEVAPKAARRSRRDFLATAGASLAILAAGESAGWAKPSDAPAIPQATSNLDPYGSVRGVDYYPSWCRSLPDLWTQYDRDAVRFELSLARELGFNSVRVWLGTTPWQQLGNEMWNRVDHFLATSQQFGMKVIPCIFDSCGVETSTYTGEVVSIPEAYARAMKNPKTTDASRERMRLLAGPYVETAGRNAWCPYSEIDPTTILWQWHAPSPGYSLLGQEHWPKWEKYLRQVLGRFGDHPAVLVWDLMNEPNCIRIFNVAAEGGLGFDQKIVYRFIERMREVAETVKPRKPITLGFENQLGMRQMASAAEVLSFHTYEPDVSKLEAMLAGEKAFAASQKKPLLLTEAAAVLFIRGTADTDDATQVDLYRKSIPVLERGGIGYYMVALMAGRFPFAWVGFLRPDGTRKPVADYIESMLRPKRGSRA